MTAIIIPVNVASLQTRIQDLTEQLNGLGQPPDNVPQFALSTNAVRQNEYLTQKSAIQSDLIQSYILYIDIIKETATDLVDMQHQLIELVRIQMKRN